MKTSQVIIKTFKFIFFTVLLALIALIVVLSLSFKDLKSVANKALNGKNYLETSIVYAGEKNWTNALEENRKAQEEIDSSLQLIDKLKNKLIFSKISFLQNQIIDLEYLLKTASLISHSPVSYT